MIRGMHAAAAGHLEEASNEGHRCPNIHASPAFSRGLLLVAGVCIGLLIRTDDSGADFSPSAASFKSDLRTGEVKEYSNETLLPSASGANLTALAGDFKVPLHDPVGRLSASLRPFGCPANEDEAADCALNRTLNLHAWANQAAALEFIVRCHEVNGVVLFTTVYARPDTPQVLEWLPNWLAGIRKAFPPEFSAKRLIVGVDEESCAAIAGAGVQGCVVDGSHWWKRREQIAGASAPFHIATSLKFLYAHAALRLGYTILFADIDVAWSGKGDVLEYLMGPKRRIAAVPNGDDVLAAVQAQLQEEAQKEAVAGNTTTPPPSSSLPVAANATMPLPSPSAETAANTTTPLLSASPASLPLPLPLRGNAVEIGAQGLPDIQMFSDFIGCPQPHVSRTAAGSSDWRDALYDVDAYRNPCPLAASYGATEGSYTCLSTGFFMMQPSERISAFMNDLMRMMTESLLWEQTVYNHAVWKYVAGIAEGAVPPHQALSLVMLDARVIGNAEEAGCSMQISDGGLDWRLPSGSPLPGAPLHVATVAKPPPAPPQLAMHLGYVSAHTSKIFLAQQAGYWHVDIRARTANMLLRQRSVPSERLEVAVKAAAGTSTFSAAACVYLIVGGNSNGRALAVPETFPPDAVAPLVGQSPLIQAFPLDDRAIDAAAAVAADPTQAATVSWTADKATRMSRAAAPPLPAGDGSCLSQGMWARFAWEILPPLQASAGNAQSRRRDGAFVVLAHRLPPPSPPPTPAPTPPPAPVPPPGAVGGPGSAGYGPGYGPGNPSGYNPYGNGPGSAINGAGGGTGVPSGSSPGDVNAAGSGSGSDAGSSLRGSRGGVGGPMSTTNAAIANAPYADPSVKRVYIGRAADGGNGLRLVATPEEALPFELQPCETRFDGYVGFQLPVDLQPPDLRLQLFGDIEAASLRAVHPGALDSAPQHKAQACWLPVT